MCAEGCGVGYDVSDLMIRVSGAERLKRLLWLALFLGAQWMAAASGNEVQAKWDFHSLTPGGHPETAAWRPATVPGVVQTDLLQQKLIPDPFYGDNEYRLQWIGLSDWEYRGKFEVSAATLAQEHVDLVFDGLDTFAEVFVNDRAALTADNMFRTWRISAKPMLHPGRNEVRVVFRSPVNYVLPTVRGLPYVLPSISTSNFGNEEGIATAPYTRKAPYNYGWDWGPRFVTEGIWRPVHLEMWDGLRIESFHIHQQSITKELAKLTAEMEIEADRPMTTQVSFSHFQGEVIAGAPFSDLSLSVSLDLGINHVSAPISIPNPKLWYPAGCGAQDRYMFFAYVAAGKSKTRMQIATLKTGL